MHQATRRALSSAFLFLSSCGSPAPVAPAPTPIPTGPARVAAVHVTAASSSAVTTPAAPPRPPAPPKPDGIDAGDFAMLADLCALALWAGPSGPMVGCRSAPPFDTPEKKPDGELRRASDFSDVCFLDHVYRGSFTGPGKEQAIFGLEACGPERWNDITPGNVALAERGPDGWRVLAVQPATNVRTCSISKREDRTRLVCSDNFGAFGDGSIAWRFTLDFAADDHVQVFAKIYASAPTSCMMGTSMLEERGVTTIDVTKESFADVDGDGDEDLSFVVERAHAAPSPALSARADAQCKSAKDGQMVDLARLAGPKRRFTLQFRGEATTMVPTEATKKLLDAWGTESPEFWWNAVKTKGR